MLAVVIHDGSSTWAVPNVVIFMYKEILICLSDKVNLCEVAIISPIQLLNVCSLNFCDGQTKENVL